MPDGELRRPPQLWEQRLSRITSVLSVGLGTSGDTSIVDPTPAPGAGGGTEPAPVLPSPGEFIKPSTPSLIGQVQGINVIWDGLNSAGDLWPYDTSWVEVHLDTTGTAFTPGTATLQGRLSRPGNFYLGGLTSGTAYYVKLMGADPAGNYTDPSDAATGYTGLTTSGDYGTATIGSGAVSFDARSIGGVTTTVGTATPSGAQDGDIWLDTTGGATTHKRYNGSIWETQAWGSSSLSANCITATQMAAGAVTAGAIAAGAVTTDKLTAGTINGFYITGSTISAGYLSGGTISAGYLSGGTISGGYISGGAVTGAVLESSSSGNKVRIDSGDRIVFYYSSGVRAELAGVIINGNNGLGLTGSLDVNGNLYTTYNIIVGSGMGVLPEGSSNLRLMAGKVQTPGYLVCQNVYDYYGSVSANVYVATDGKIYRATSSERYKFRIVPMLGQLADVPAEKISTIELDGAVDIWDVLDLAPAQFASLEEARREVDPETGEEITPAPERTFLGFIAEDVAAKFPIAAEWNDDGEPESYDYRAILSALLGVVREQRDTITDLTARVEALEGI